MWEFPNVSVTPRTQDLDNRRCLWKEFFVTNCISFLGEEGIRNEQRPDREPVGTWSIGLFVHNRNTMLNHRGAVDLSTRLQWVEVETCSRQLGNQTQQKHQFLTSTLCEHDTRHEITTGFPEHLTSWPLGERNNKMSEENDLGPVLCWHLEKHQLFFPLNRDTLPGRNDTTAWPPLPVISATVSKRRNWSHFENPTELFWSLYKETTITNQPPHICYDTQLVREIICGITICGKQWKQLPHVRKQKPSAENSNLQIARELKWNNNEGGERRLIPHELLRRETHFWPTIRRRKVPRGSKFVWNLLSPNNSLW